MKNLHFILGLFFASITFGNISPYLQTPSPTSIYICWKTDNGTESRVKYGTTTSLGEVADGDYESIASQYIWHIVKLTNLNPNLSFSDNIGAYVVALSVLTVLFL